MDTSSPRRTSFANPRTSGAFGPMNRGTGPQEIKGKYEETTGGDSSLPENPIDPAFARVDNFTPATKPKIEEYDKYVRETAPQLRARMNSILGDKSHEAGFERKLPEPEGLPKLEPEQEPSLLDKVKDTVTGQVPGHGIYSGKATIEQDVGMGSNVEAGTPGGRFDRDTAHEPGKEGSGVPGPNPNEDRLHDNMDDVDRLRDTVAATAARRPSAGEEVPVVTAPPEGGPARHPRSAMSSTNTPQGAGVRRGTLP